MAKLYDVFHIVLAASHCNLKLIMRVSAGSNLGCYSVPNFRSTGGVKIPRVGEASMCVINSKKLVATLTQFFTFILKRFHDMILEHHAQ